MTGSVRRVTIVAGARRLDLAVPADVPVVDLLPDVVALLTEPVSGPGLPRWSLGRPLGGDLPPSQTLEAAGVEDGTVLRLRRVDEPAVGLHGVDPVEAAGAAAGAPHAADRLLLCAAAAGLLALVAWVLARAGGDRRAGAAVLLALAAVAAGRRLQAGAAGTPAGAAVLALAAVPLCAAAAVSPVAAAQAVPVGLLGAGAGAVLAALAVLPARLPGLAVAAAAALATGAVLLGRTVGAGQGAAVTAVLAVLAVPALPRLVLRLTTSRPGGSVRSDLVRPAAPSGLPVARTALGWALAVSGALVVGGCVVLARTTERAGWTLGAVCGLLLVLRSRDLRGVVALPLAVAGHAGVAVIGVGLALARPASPGPLVVLCASATVYALAAGVPEAAVDAPRWARRRRLLEFAALAGLVPLLAQVLGVFGWVVDAARGVE